MPSILFPFDRLPDARDWRAAAETQRKFAAGVREYVNTYMAQARLEALCFLRSDDVGKFIEDVILDEFVDKFEMAEAAAEEHAAEEAA